MRNNAKIAILPLVAALLLTAPGARAFTPTLTLSSAGGDSVQVNVTGDANSGVILVYSAVGAAGMQSRSIGTTNSSGFFSTVISTSAYGISTGSSAYVTVNAQSSIMVVWPYSGSSTNTLNLSQTNIVLSPGQSTTISASGVSNPLYVSNISNSSVANFTAIGTQVTITASNTGATTATVCAQYGSSNCATVYVTVQSGGSQTITFGQNNINIATGQYIAVSISGGSGNYFVSNNSNPGAVQAAVSGSSLGLTAFGSSGTTVVTVCSSGTGSCGTLSATVNGYNNTSVSFSQNNLSMLSGSNQSVTVYGNGNYIVSNNSNSNAATTYLNGNTLTVYGNSAGTANLTVCQLSGGCGTLSVTVGSGTGGSLSFSQANPSVAVGQSITVTVSGGNGNYYISSNSNPSVASAGLNGNMLTISGGMGGTSSVAVCSASGGNCATLLVTVGSGTTGSVFFSQTNPSVAAGQTTNVMLSGGSGSYYLSSPADNIVQASINGNALALYGINQGSSSVVVCSYSGGCSALSVTVTGTGTYGGIPLPAGTVAQQIQALELQLAQLMAQAGMQQNTINTTPYSYSYSFGRYLGMGSSGSDVLALQQKLTDQGIYFGPITGYYWNLTAAAVRQYQALHGLPSTGTVNSATLAVLNSE